MIVTNFNKLTFYEVLDDLQCRFIINVPAEELSSVERICFQIEQAHWFYEDFVREENLALPSLSLRAFCKKFFSHCPLLRLGLNAADHDHAFNTFIEYKVRVPVCGAILLNQNMTKAVLVKGWKSSSGWSFPKGKINKDEPEHECAAREVWEETGFDIKPLLREQEYVERTIREQRIRLYIIVGVPESTVFTPQTRKEISALEWFKLKELPGYSVDTNPANHALKKSRFYLVTSFVGSLKTWIIHYKKSKGKSIKSSKYLQVVSGYRSNTDVESEVESGYVGGPIVEPRMSEVGMTDSIKQLMGLGGGDVNGTASNAIPSVVSNAASLKDHEASIKALIGLGGGGDGTPPAVAFALTAQQSPPIPIKAESHIPSANNSQPPQLLQSGPPTAATAVFSSAVPTVMPVPQPFPQGMIQLNPTQFQAMPTQYSAVMIPGGPFQMVGPPVLAQQPQMQPQPQHILLNSAGVPTNYGVPGPQPPYQGIISTAEGPAVIQILPLQQGFATSSPQTQFAPGIPAITSAQPFQMISQPQPVPFPPQVIPSVIPPPPPLPQHIPQQQQQQQLQQQHTSNHQPFSQSTTQPPPPPPPVHANVDPRMLAHEAKVEHRKTLLEILTGGSSEGLGLPKPPSRPFQSLSSSSVETTMATAGESQVNAANPNTLTRQSPSSNTPHLDGTATSVQQQQPFMHSSQPSPPPPPPQSVLVSAPISGQHRPPPPPTPPTASNTHFDQLTKEDKQASLLNILLGGGGAPPGKPSANAPNAPNLVVPPPPSRLNSQPPSIGNTVQPVPSVMDFFNQAPLSANSGAPAQPPPKQSFQQQQQQQPPMLGLHPTQVSSADKRDMLLGILRGDSSSSVQSDSAESIAVPLSVTGVAPQLGPTNANADMSSALKSFLGM